MLSITGYASMFVFLPIHFLTHRYYPATIVPSRLGPISAELDYEFVKLGLATWPWRSWALYVGFGTNTLTWYVGCRLYDVLLNVF
jgi:hypothetical protein